MRTVITAGIDSDGIDSDSIDSDGIDSDDDTEGFNDPSNSPYHIATPKEKYLWGLLKGKNYDRGNVIVKHVEGRRRWRNIWELYKGYNHCASRRVLMIHHVVLYDALHLRLSHLWQVTTFVSMVAQYEKRWERAWVINEMPFWVMAAIVWIQYTTMKY